MSADKDTGSTMTILKFKWIFKNDEIEILKQKITPGANIFNYYFNNNNFTLIVNLINFAFAR